MTDERHFVIAGASLAGAKAAMALREQGFEGAVTLVGSEEHHPYERPPLSKDYLQGKVERASVFVTDEDWYEKNHVDLRRGVTAVDLDTPGHVVTLGTGEELRYDRLLIATGAAPRRLELAGSDLGGVYYLRSIDDSERLRSLLSAGGRHLVIVGAGWIGLELAASAKSLGDHVVVLDNGSIPLERVIGSDLGTMFAELHRENGVDIRPSATVAGFVGREGRVSGVAVSGEDVVPADLVVVGIGAVPNTALALSGSLELDDGILVDASLRTSDPDVYAAGDVANPLHPVLGRRLRSEHWQNAIWTGESAARSMLGQEVAFDRIPYFFTDQFDLGLEYSGYAPLAENGTVVYRGDRAKREFIAFWLTSENRVVAGMNVNVWDVNDQVQRLIGGRKPVDPEKLRDPEGSLDTL